MGNNRPHTERCDKTENTRMHNSEKDDKSKKYTKWETNEYGNNQNYG